jgi:hypothetical protein
MAILGKELVLANAIEVDKNYAVMNFVVINNAGY